VPRIAMVFVARRAGVSRVSQVAGWSIARGTGISGVPPIAVVSIGRGSEVTGTSRIAWVSVGHWWIARISVSRIPISGRSVAWVAIPVGRVAVIGARWWRRCSSDAPKYSGCSTDRRSEGASVNRIDRRTDRHAISEREAERSSEPAGPRQRPLVRHLELGRRSEGELRCSSGALSLGSGLD